MGKPSVYYSMTNGGIIEGNTENSGFSDLNLAIGYAGQHYYNESDIWRIAGTGNPLILMLKRRRISVPSILFFHVPVLDEVFVEIGLGNPDEKVFVEKHKKAQSPRRAISSHQKARILVAWKNLIYSRSRMGLQWSRCSCEGGSRYPASAIRFNLGSGETLHENASGFRRN